MKFVICCGAALIAGLVAQATVAQDKVQTGSATYWLAPKSGDSAMPAAPYRTEKMLQQAAPTNQWYSTLIFDAKPQVIYVQPLTVKASAAGFEMALPSEQVVSTVRRDVEIHYPHTDPIVISPVAFALGQPKLAKVSDWSIDIAMDQGADQMLVTVAHGSPYASIRLSRGDVRIKLPSAGERIAAADPRVLALKIKNKPYALFGPTGVSWEPISATEWVGHLPAGKAYVNAAALTDDKPETLALFTRHAYAFIDSTKVEWHFDVHKSQVESNFKVTTEVMEGPDNGPLIGLYPHQWFNNPNVEGKLGAAYDTVRGKIKLLPASAFKTVYAYNAFVPYWPAIKASPKLDLMLDLSKKDVRMRNDLILKEGQGAYWQGKGLQRLVKLMDVLEQQGDLDARNQILKLLESRAQEWFSGDNRQHYFAYDKSLGALASYPDEFFTIEQINDHHFTYGYWIRAVAEIAMRDPAWAAKEKWGGVIDMMVKDIATTQRGRADFPFLRNFDVYEGHSWASGIGIGDMGNNQESSSEAVNAWAALIEWGEFTGNTELRDVGAYLMATESEGIINYVFDVHHIVFSSAYKNVEVSQVFGGAYLHNTWWTDEPREIKGINLLPITTASLYLGRDQGYIKKNLEALKPEMAIYADRGSYPRNPPPKDVWQDIFAKYMALADPRQGLEMWDRWGSFELGDTRTATLHWLLSLDEMGTPDFSVTADTSFYSVFKKETGLKTYLAFNAGKAPITVQFSDGKVLQVAPATLAKTQ